MEYKFKVGDKVRVSKNPKFPERFFGPKDTVRAFKLSYDKIYTIQEIISSGTYKDKNKLILKEDEHRHNPYEFRFELIEDKEYNELFI